eukprot:scaffold624_cov402-Prasinococcus_capsulatus_cf.AAC.13
MRATAGCYLNFLVGPSPRRLPASQTQTSRVPPPCQEDCHACAAPSTYTYPVAVSAGLAERLHAVPRLQPHDEGGPALRRLAMVVTGQRGPHALPGGPSPPAASRGEVRTAFVNGVGCCRGRGPARRGGSAEGLPPSAALSAQPTCAGTRKMAPVLVYSTCRVRRAYM